jgi:hypothetical protein
MTIIADQETRPDPWQTQWAAKNNNPDFRRRATIEDMAEGRCCKECLRFHREGVKCLLADITVKRNWVCDAFEPGQRT